MLINTKEEEEKKTGVEDGEVEESDQTAVEIGHNFF